MPSERQRLWLLAACLLTAVAVDGLDYVTGEDYELFVFYFIPIAVAAWWIGREAGILLAMVSAVSWFESDFLSHAPYAWSIGAWDTLMRLTAFLVTAVALAKLRDELTRERKLNTELSDAMAEIKQLRGILPMCSFCRKIRDEQGQWTALEKYISDHSNAQVSHGLCPICYKKHYGQENGT